MVYVETESGFSNAQSQGRVHPFNIRAENIIFLRQSVKKATWWRNTIFCSKRKMYSLVFWGKTGETTKDQGIEGLHCHSRLDLGGVESESGDSREGTGEDQREEYLFLCVLLAYGGEKNFTCSQWSLGESGEVLVGSSPERRRGVRWKSFFGSKGKGKEGGYEGKLPSR